MEPYHKIQKIIAKGDYISPQQLWYDYKWPTIYTKQIIINLAKEIKDNGLD